ncbi:MAG: tetratricopeptide repeat protein [Bacteroidales bacterium]|nr:tetratricopeptide repeat protein [Bacteroidales bacterium]
MKKYLTILLLFAVIPAFAQVRDLRRGNREFRKGEYAEADISYRKGLLKDSTSVAARYNLANNLYRQGNYDEAAKQMDAVPQDSLKNDLFTANYFFNRGNIAIAQDDWQKAVESYIQCLMLTPNDIEAKENYTYARYHLQNQQQNQNGDGDNDQNQDQDQQDQQNQDQNKDQQDQNQQQQPQPVEISPQQAQQILQAIQEKERETQDKVDKEKAAALKSRQKEKNW